MCMHTMDHTSGQSRFPVMKKQEERPAEMSQLRC